MNSILSTKDIRFNDKKINILLRGGVVSRDVLRNAKDSIIEMHDVPFGIAKRINDVVAIDVKHMDTWYNVLCGNEDLLRDIYTMASIKEEEKNDDGETICVKIVFSDSIATKEDLKAEGINNEEIVDHPEEIIDDSYSAEEIEEETPIYEDADSDSVEEEVSDNIEETINDEESTDDSKFVQPQSQNNAVRRVNTNNKNHKRHR